MLSHDRWQNGLVIDAGLSDQDAETLESGTEAPLLRYEFFWLIDLASLSKITPEWLGHRGYPHAPFFFGIGSLQLQVLEAGLAG